MNSMDKLCALVKHYFIPEVADNIIPELIRSDNFVSDSITMPSVAFKLLQPKDLRSDGFFNTYVINGFTWSCAQFPVVQPSLKSKYWGDLNDDMLTGNYWMFNENAGPFVWPIPENIIPISNKTIKQLIHQLNEAL